MVRLLVACTLLRLFLVLRRHIVGQELLDILCVNLRFIFYLYYLPTR